MPHGRRMPAWLRPLSLLLSLFIAMTGLVAVAAPSQATGYAVPSLAAPTGLKLTSRAITKLAVSWKAVPAASRYLVEYSTSSGLKRARTKSTSKPYVELSGLAKKRTYYVRVKAVDSAGRALGPTSSILKVRTRGSGYKYLAPTAVKTTPAVTTMKVSWTSTSSNVKYRVTYSTSSSFTKAKTKDVSAKSTTLTKLKPETRYYVRVRVLKRGKLHSSNSATVSATTRSAAERDAAGLRVASFNVRKMVANRKPNEEPWAQRRGVIVKQIRDQRVDVIGIQEASSRGVDGDSALTQYVDLERRLGTPYRLVDDDLMSSVGTRILYNTATVTLVRDGFQKLTALDTDRFVVWAEFVQNSTGKSFFFTNTHLEDGGGASYDASRAAEAKQIVELTRKENPAGLPVLAVGDYNSHQDMDNRPYRVMLAAGYVDPLGNQWPLKTRRADATVETAINTEYSSGNHFDLVAPRTKTAVNGIYLDYIFTSAGVAVPEWETVVDIDSQDRFIGTIPSDHNLIRATVTLP